MKMLNAQSKVLRNDEYNEAHSKALRIAFCFTHWIVWPLRTLLDYEYIYINIYIYIYICIYILYYIIYIYMYIYIYLYRYVKILKPFNDVWDKKIKK